MIPCHSKLTSPGCTGRTQIVLPEQYRHAGGQATRHKSGRSSENQPPGNRPNRQERALKHRNYGSVANLGNPGFIVHQSQIPVEATTLPDFFLKASPLDRQRRPIAKIPVGILEFLQRALGSSQVDERGIQPLFDEHPFRPRTRLTGFDVEPIDLQDKLLRNALGKVRPTGLDGDRHRPQLQVGLYENGAAKPSSHASSFDRLVRSADVDKVRQVATVEAVLGLDRVRATPNRIQYRPRLEHLLEMQGRCAVGASTEAEALREIKGRREAVRLLLLGTKDGLRSILGLGEQAASRVHGTQCKSAYQNQPSVTQERRNKPHQRKLELWLSVLGRCIPGASKSSSAARRPGFLSHVFLPPPPLQLAKHPCPPMSEGT